MSKLYPNGKLALETAAINLLSDPIYVAMVDITHYTYSDNDQFFSSVAAAVVGTPAQLTGPSCSVPVPGVFSSGNVLFPTVTGNPFGALVIYKNTGNNLSSPLIAYIDGVSGTPNGGDIVVAWDTGPFRIFSL